MTDPLSLDSSLVAEEVFLDRGLFGTKKYEVSEGTVAVMRSGGRYYTTYLPGQHTLGEFPAGPSISALVVDVRPRRTTYESRGDLSISESDQYGNRWTVKIHVKFVIEYHVEAENARNVSETALPVQRLLDAVQEQLQTILFHSSFEEFASGGTRLAGTLSDVLRTPYIVNLTGITVDRVGHQILQPANSTERRELNRFNESRIPFGQQVLDVPTVRKIILENFADLVAIGLDPTMLLTRPEQAAAIPLISGLLQDSMTQTDRQQPPIHGDLTHNARLTGSQFEKPLPSRISPERLVDELDRLERDGWSQSAEPVTKGANRRPDGSYNVLATKDLSDSARLRIQFHLPIGYEQGVAPNRVVYLDNELQSFPDIDSEEWHKERNLAELADEVLRLYS